MELETLYGDPELMGRGFFRRQLRRVKPSYLVPGYGQYALKRDLIRELRGEEPELMGRSFWARQASIVSRNVRPLSSKLLDLGAKIPIASSYVSGFRTASNLLNPGGGPVALQQIKTPSPEPKIPETPNSPDKSPSWSMGKKLAVGGGLAVLVLGAIMLAKKKKKSK